MIEGLLEEVEELSAEHDAEGFDTEQEVFTGGDPVVLIERQHSIWEQAMEVEVVFELLIPGVQDTDKAWGSPKVSASEGQESFGDGLKQEVEENSFISEHEGVELMREGKDRVEGAHGKKL